MSLPTPTVTPVPSTSTSTPGVENLTGIEYLPGWELDVYLPETPDASYPTLLLLHGAGGPTRESLEPLSEYLIQRGYATVLADREGDGLWDWMDYFPNAFCTLAWLHVNAESFGFDSERVVVFGHLAGEHAAAMIGTVDDPVEFMEYCPYEWPVSNSVKGVVTYGAVVGTKEFYLSAPIDFSENEIAYNLYDGSLILSEDEREEIRKTMLDTPYAEWQEITGLSSGGEQVLLSLAPYWVDGSEVPFLLLQGAYDFIDIASPEAFVALLQETGVEATLTVIPGGDHQAIMNSSSPGFERACEAIAAFVAEVIE